MFASSSTSLRPLGAIASSSRHFSSTTLLKARRKELVELLADHPQLGSKGDRILVQPGHARHRLVPKRIARWVPNWRWYGIKPFTKMAEMSDSPQIAAPSPATAAAPEQAEPKEDVPTPQEVLNELHLLPESLVFSLPATDDGVTLYGSLTLSDIILRLAELGVTTKHFVVAWAEDEVSPGAGDRIKAVGTRKARVQVKAGGKEAVEIQVEVKPLEAAV